MCKLLGLVEQTRGNPNEILKRKEMCLDWLRKKDGKKVVYVFG